MCKLIGVADALLRIRERFFEVYNPMQDCTSPLQLTFIIRILLSHKETQLILCVHLLINNNNLKL